jgi:hypothetical protein
MAGIVTGIVTGKVSVNSSTRKKQCTQQCNSGLRLRADGGGDEHGVITVAQLGVPSGGEVDPVREFILRQHDSPRDGMAARTARPRTATLLLDEGDQG